MTFVFMLITCFAIGWFAQAKKGRTGAFWGFITMAILIPAWLIIYFSTHAVQPSLYKDDAGWYAAALMVCLLVGGIMALVVASLPKRQTEEGRVPCPQCAELIPAAAKKCRFCGADTTPPAQPRIRSLAP
jgi:hypothetical protein